MAMKAARKVLRGFIIVRNFPNRLWSKCAECLFAEVCKILCNSEKNGEYNFHYTALPIYCFHASNAKNDKIAFILKAAHSFFLSI